MQIDVHRIDAEVAGPDLADDRVEIGAVAINQPAGRMHRLRDRDHVRLEQAAGVGVGDHHRRDVRPEPRLQGGEVDPAGRVRGDVLDPIAGERGGRRVGAVRALGHEHDLALVAARFERGADAEQAAQLAVGAGLGAHRHAVHAGQLEQPLGKLVDHRQRALHRFLRLERMDVGETGQPRDLLVQARVVLHRARSEREQAEVDRVILPRQPGVMPHRLGLAEAGKADRTVAGEVADPRFDLRNGGEIDAGLVGRSDLEQQGLLEHQRAVAGHGPGFAMLIGGRRRPPAGRIDGHRTTSRSAPSNAAISSSVTVSVTATTSPRSSASTPG